MVSRVAWVSVVEAVAPAEGLRVGGKSVRPGGSRERTKD